ncbi:MAG: FimV/HubP family polar landmark protein [Halieaceae bacterium]|jgi:pilus assembly protein FimV|nr:FimV/HubP family polar landmark protein [Halieaceae bacterium]
MNRIWRPFGVAAIFPLMSSPSWGLGLGEIDMRSFLNEPLQAEIRLLDVSGLSADDIRIRLATQDDFDRLGVDRAYFLTNLQFSVEIDDRDSGRIVLTTEDPLLEPYLDFIIETRWPSGRLLREYTVLVDLPSESSAPLVASSRVTAPEPESDEREPARSTPAAAPAPAPAVTERRYTRGAEAKPSTGGQYLVEQADTLWAIAARARPEGASVEQTMLATVGLNPEAFAGGNINGLKAGYVLDLPAESDITLSQREAINAVAQQNNDWAAGLRTAPALRVVADSDLTDSDSDSQADDTDALSSGMASDRDSMAEAGTTVPGEPAEASADLVAIQSQLGQLSAQIESLRELVTIKDAQIAELQARLADTETAPAVVPAPDDTLPPAETAEATQQPVVVEPQVSQPAVTAPKRPEPSGLMGVPWWQVGTFGAVVLAVLGYFVMRRRSDSEVAAPTLAQTLGATAPVKKEPAAEVPAAAPADAEPAADPESAADMEEGGERGYGKRLYNEYAAENPLSDAIAEADIYIAYGRYQQALDLLKTALDNDPGNASGYLKMLDIYIRTDRLEEARALLGPIRETDNAEAIAQAEEKLAELDEKAAAAADIDLGELAAPISADTTSADADPADRDAVGGANAMNELSFDLEPVVAPSTEDAAEPDDSVNEVVDTLDSDRAEQGVVLGDELELDLEPALEQGNEPRADWGDDAEPEVAETTETDDKLPPELAEVLGTEVAPEPGQPSDDDDDDEGGLVYATEADPMDTKLDLARAYIDMGDEEGARPVLEEVIQDGDLQQQAEARELLLRIE